MRHRHLPPVPVIEVRRDRRPIRLTRFRKYGYYTVIEILRRIGRIPKMKPPSVIQRPMLPLSRRNQGAETTAQYKNYPHRKISLQTHSSRLSAYPYYQRLPARNPGTAHSSPAPNKIPLTHSLHSPP